MKLNRRGIIGLAAAAVIAGGGSAAFAAVSANPVTTVTAVTHVSNDPDGGNGGTWAYDTFDRTLTVTIDPTTTDCANATGLVFSAGADYCYTATVTDKGTFETVPGALAPDQSTAGVKIANSVQGTLSGSASYLVSAPQGDVLSSAAVATAHDDTFGTPAVTDPFTTGTWPKQAFLTSAGHADAAVSTVYALDSNKNQQWSWKYDTGCETWTDAGSNSAGNLPGDGNITGKVCATAPATGLPDVYAGHVVTVSNNRATVAWSEGGDWSAYNANGKCEEVWISGYGFGAWDPADPANPGTSHVGFTCDHGSSGTNLGYLTGLAAGHTYALRVVPATGTYGSHQPIPGASVGYVDVFTTR
jgi:hypothetical protein